MGDEELTRIILQGFLADMPKQIEALHGYLESGDAAGAISDDHPLSTGNLSLYGRTPLQEELVAEADLVLAIGERELAACPLGHQADAVAIDFHAEATSEKMCFAHFVDELRSGISKVEILGRLRYSAEGRVRGVQVDGLRFRFALQRAYRLPLAGGLLRLAAAVHGDVLAVRAQRGGVVADHLDQLLVLGVQVQPSQAALGQGLVSMAHEDPSRDQPTKGRAAEVGLVVVGVQQHHRAVAKDRQQPGQRQPLAPCGLARRQWRDRRQRDQREQRGQQQQAGVEQRGGPPVGAARQRGGEASSPSLTRFVRPDGFLAVPNVGTISKIGGCYDCFQFVRRSGSGTDQSGRCT